MTNKQYIGFLMDLSDGVAKARREMDGFVASSRVMTAEEHEAIKTLLLGIQVDAGMADSVRFGKYEWTKEKCFGVPTNLSK